MALTFSPPSYRAASGDLTVQVSPLGLVELSDEEFEVHGPRLSRYALYWAHYLGHMQSHMREVGEPNFSFNYVRALSDYITSFTLGKGVGWRCPAATQSIILPALNRVWEQDNDKDSVLWEIGVHGGVSGDMFVKVAYEDPFVDPAGRLHPGRVRLIPLNAAQCVDEETEALTRDGWKRYDEVGVGTEILTIDPQTDEIRWQPMTGKVERRHSGKMHRWKNERFDSLTTDGHRWLMRNSRSRKHEFKLTKDVCGTNSGGCRIVSGGGVPLAFPEVEKYSDEWVELAAWFVTEGTWNRTHGAQIYQSEVANPENVARIRRLAVVLRDQGFRVTEQPLCEGRETISWYLGSTVAAVLREIVSDKAITPEFLTSLTFHQAHLFYDVLMLGDGHRGDSERWYQDDAQRVDGFQMLAAMLGKRSFARKLARGKGRTVSVYQNRFSSLREMERTEEDYDGIVWCPQVEATTWLSRRNGVTTWTGNCFPQWHPHDRQRMISFKLKYRFWNTAPTGERQVYTYTELITDVGIEEYINDRLVDSRPNPIGMIPIAYEPNIKVPGSPWGLPDIDSVIPLNRELNEKALEVSDIINYHSAPLTVVVGAKLSNIEKGASRVITLPKEASMTNLQGLVELDGPMAYMDYIKRAMHEMTGVPEQALGQMQPISNTSGVALHIQYQPLMNRYDRKTTSLSKLFRKLNELIILTLAQKEPRVLEFDPMEAAAPQPGQPLVLDPSDPNTFETAVHWPPPLPVDVLVKLNEIQAKMGLGLESKEGALRDLGEDTPREKLDEIAAEQYEDAKDAGALSMINSAIAAAIQLATGIVPGDPAGGIVPPEGGGGKVTTTADTGPSLPGPMVTPEIQQMAADLVNRAYGGKLAQYRNPANTSTD